MQINESAEDYLESILIFQTRDGAARSIDIARHLGVTKPSVSRAMKLLRDSNYTISEVAYQAGFTDPKYFSRTFKKATGLTPTEYRDQQ